MNITAKDIEQTIDNVDPREKETHILFDHDEKKVTFFTTQHTEIKNLVSRLLPEQILDFKSGGNCWTLVAEMEAFGPAFRASKKRK